jgi:hypothetical protein
MKMKTKIFISVFVVIVLASCSPMAIQLAAPTPICLDCDQDGMITPQELQDVFTKMRDKVKIIEKSQPSVAATLEEKIASLENEVVDTDPFNLDLSVVIRKMGQLEREINSAIASINTEQAAQAQTAQNLTIGGVVVAVFLVLAVFLFGNRKRKRIHTSLVNKTSSATKKMVEKQGSFESNNSGSDSKGKPCPKCGKYPHPNDSYCIKCGEKLK